MAKQQTSILRNTIANWSGMAVAVAVTMVLSKYALQSLGKERFGVFGIARQFLGYMLILDLGILGAVNRFTGRYVALGDDPSLNRVASSSFYLYLSLSGVAVIVTLAAAWIGPGFFRVKAAYVAESRFLFLALGLNFVMLLMMNTWKGVLLGHNRFDLLNFGRAGASLLNLAMVYAIFEAGLVNLEVLALTFVCSTVIQFAYARLAVWRIHPTIRVSRRSATRDGLKEVLGVSLWNMLFVVGNMIVWSSDNVVVGRLLGPERVPYYFFPFQFISLGQMLVGGLSVTLTPVAAGVAARSSLESLRSLLVRASRIATLIVLCVNGVMLVLIQSFLGLWLGPEYAEAWLVYPVLMISFWAVLAFRPAYNMVLGAGSLRGPALGAFLCGLLAIALKVVFVTVFHWGLLGVAWGTAIPMFFYWGLAMPWVASRLVKMSVWRLYRQACLGPLICLGPVAGAGWTLVRYLPPPNLLVWSAYFTLLCAAYTALGWLVLEPADRQRLLGLLKRFRPSRQAPDEVPDDGSGPGG